jgi:hypothetical protein
MPNTPAREGFETFTGAFLKVVFVPDRAAEGLPAWQALADGQYFMDSEVDEVDPWAWDEHGFPIKKD